jgi:acyl dehydratase
VLEGLVTGGPSPLHVDVVAASRVRVERGPKVHRLRLAAAGGRGKT